MNDVFIYSDGSYQDHISKVKKVLRRFHKAGLKFDIEKSEFASSKVKYLRFIISAEEGIKINPGKIEVIKKWKAPITVKKVRNFMLEVSPGWKPGLQRMRPIRGVERM
jgi:hypothetical protein